VLIDKTHVGWAIGAGAATGLAAVLYVVFATGRSDASGGSAIGLLFGIFAFLAMAFAGLLAVRKSFRVLPFGSAQFWLRGHIWIGLASVPLVLFHSNFRLGGVLEMALMAVFFIVIASGVFGLALQQVLPRFLKVRVPLETFPQQIPSLLKKFREEADDLLKSLSVPAKTPPAKTASAVAAPVAAGAAATSAQSKLELLKRAESAKAAKDAADPEGASAANAANAPEGAATVAATEDAAKAPSKPAAKTGGLSPLEILKASKSAGASASIAANPAAKPAAVKPSSDVLEKLKAAKQAVVMATAPAPNAAPPAEAPTVKAAEQGPAAVVSAAKFSPPPATAKPFEKRVAAAAALTPRLEKLMRFHHQEILPFLNEDIRIAARQKLRSENFARMAFAELSLELPDKAAAVVSRLAEIVDERRQFLAQVRIQSWMHSWLLVHVPLSAALFALALVHIVMALRVVPWSL
jgi:hypothetical protein